MAINSKEYKNLLMTFSEIKSKVDLDIDEDTAIVLDNIRGYYKDYRTKKHYYLIAGFVSSKKDEYLFELEGLIKEIQFWCEKIGININWMTPNSREFKSQIYCTFRLGYQDITNLIDMQYREIAGKLNY